jgi:ankyrin repeat protein
MWAVEYSSKELVRMLIKFGADPNVSIRGGWTPLFSAMQLGRQELACDLVAAKADPNVVSTRDARFPLIDAVIWNQAKLFHALVDAGASVNMVDAEGRTPLLEAASRRQMEMVEVLFSKGADPRIKDSKGRAAVMYVDPARYASVEPGAWVL